MNLRIPCVCVFAVVLINTVVSGGFLNRIRRDDTTTAAAAPAEGGVKKCVKCTKYDNCAAKDRAEMDCTKDPLESIKNDLGDTERKLYDKAVGDDFKDASKGTHCLIIQWEKAEVRTCAPEKAGDMGICEYLVDKNDKKNFTLCEVCAAGETPCNNKTEALVEKGVTDKKDGAVEISLNPVLLWCMVSAVLIKVVL